MSSSSSDSLSPPRLPWLSRLPGLMRFPGHLGEVSSQFLRLREISTDARFFSIFTRFCKREWGYGGNAVASCSAEFTLAVKEGGEHWELVLPLSSCGEAFDVGCRGSDGRSHRSFGPLESRPSG